MTSQQFTVEDLSQLEVTGNCLKMPQATVQTYGSGIISQHSKSDNLCIIKLSGYPLIYPYQV